jgi:hypothetical protein
MYVCMRTTLDFDDALLKKAKERARRTNQTLTRVIEDALRATLIGTPGPAAPVYRLALPTVKGTLLPGIDVSDRDSLYERMEERS